MEGIFVPITFFLVIAVVVIAPRYFRSREREALQATLRAAIEKGQPLPPEVIDAISRDARPAPSQGRDLRVAIVWLSIAAGVAAFGYALGFNEDTGHAYWPMLGLSAFPACIGLAFLLLAAINRGKAKV